MSGLGTKDSAIPIFSVSSGASDYCGRSGSAGFRFV
jgi:hypothetical protein